MSETAQPIKVYNPRKKFEEWGSNDQLPAEVAGLKVLVEAATHKIPEQVLAKEQRKRKHGKSDLDLQSASAAIVRNGVTVEYTDLFLYNDASTKITLTDDQGSVTLTHNTNNIDTLIDSWSVEAQLPFREQARLRLETYTYAQPYALEATDFSEELPEHRVDAGNVYDTETAAQISRVNALAARLIEKVTAPEAA